MKAPNVLYLHSHDTGRYVQSYGYAIPTPNLQRLAEQGVLFRQAFSAAPTCSPSRGALLTGQSAHGCGQIGLAHRGFSLPHVERHLAHTLHHVGYHTALFGAHHVHVDPSVLGYDRIDGIPNDAARPAPKTPYSSASTTANAIQFLENTPSQPFFMAVGYNETHRPFAAPGPAEDARFIRPPTPLPDTPEVRQDMAGFQASARILDHNMGAVLQALEANGLAENTLVICTTDHGIAFPGMKCTLTDHGIGVMLIMRGPGGFRGGVVSEALVSHLDLYPTICQLAGIEPPNWLEGRSLLPLVNGETDQLHDEVFAEVNYHAAYEPQRAVRTQRWKYIRHYSPRERVHPANVDDGPSKRLLMAHGLSDRPVDREQLFDLVFDPQERHNLAGEADLTGVLEEMRARLHAWMVRTADPLLHGVVPAPAGAIVDPNDSLQPS